MFKIAALFTDLQKYYFSADANCKIIYTVFPHIVVFVFIIFLLIQTLPCLEQGLETPSSCSQIRKVLDFETPEIPPYVTVRKKKPLPKCDFMGDTLHTTVIESSNFPISDCQGWKRLESTHIDHVAEAFGHMTLLTNDISAIHTGYSLS